MKSAREKAVALITRRLNQQRLGKLTMFNANNLIIYDNSARFFQRYKLADWYLPELMNTLAHQHIATKSVMVAYESMVYQLLLINNEARLNDKYGVSARLVYLMIRYYRQEYAKWSAQNEDKIVECKWHNENVRYQEDSAYRHKFNQKLNEFENPDLPF